MSSTNLALPRMRSRSSMRGIRLPIVFVVTPQAPVAPVCRMVRRGRIEGVLIYPYCAKFGIYPNCGTLAYYGTHAIGSPPAKGGDNNAIRSPAAFRYTTHRVRFHPSPIFDLHDQERAHCPALRGPDTSRRFHR